MRPSRDQWAMGLAQLTALRATCLRRKVGAVLLNERGHVLATGYNGVAAGLPHCNEEILKPVYHTDSRVVFNIDKMSYKFNGKYTKKFARADQDLEQCVGHEAAYPNACSGAQAPSGQSLDSCGAIHAEQNAMLQCRDVYAIHTAYVTASPCITCCKLLLNTSCQRIVFLEEYPHGHAKDLWLSAGRIWDRLEGHLVLPG